jgi:broad specificity phosphatase PhoE
MANRRTKDTLTVEEVDKNRLEVILVRHGHAIGGPDNKSKGPGLTEIGQKQAKRVAKRLSKEKFDMIYSSDLARAHETAEAIKVFHRKTKFRVMKEFREIMTYHNRTDRKPPSKEVHEHMVEQRRTLDECIPKLIRRHRKGERILIVCHGQLIKFLVSCFAGINPKKSIPFHTNNTSVNRLNLLMPEGKMTWGYGVSLLNCTKHLLPSQVT